MIQRQFFSGRDLLFLSCLALALCAFYFFTTPGATGAGKETQKFAEVFLDGAALATLALDRDVMYSPAGLPGVRIAVRGGEVGFVASDCPDKICVHTGFLSMSGQSAACLPNRVVVRVVAGYGEALDSIAY
ncbi:MAG: NusG domain II-containing protein [Synergistaceae bacterium]|nr:NusG domain II-containing protein [Synergistaceae bacterium]